MSNQFQTPIFVPILSGVTLELYAELGAKMHDVIGDAEACLQIAMNAGLDAEQWVDAQRNWNTMLRDPLMGGALSTLYMRHYREAREKLAVVSQ